MAGEKHGMCESAFRYQACNVHVPYCHLRPSRLYNIFLRHLIFEKKKTHLTYAVCFEFLCIMAETFLILSRNEQDVIKMYFGFHVNYPLFMSNFIET
jgi:hypothetical protein